MWAEDFYGEVHALAEWVYQNEIQNIQTGAKRIAQSLKDDGIIHCFGTGHSHSLCEEIFYHAGGLVPVDMITVPAATFQEGLFFSTAVERTPGLISSVLERHDLNEKDVMIVVSLSGRNAMSIDVGLEAKSRGLFTIALSSRAQAEAGKTNHPSGKNLLDIADLVIDNKGVAGNAILEKEGLPTRIGGTQIITGSLIMEMLVVQTIEECIKMGFTPPVMYCPNLPGGKEHNKEIFRKYRNRIKAF
jgi:uncharacterized phosphosugar-binding protein